jgi:uncharacterized protein (TIGR02996 family)
MTEREALLRAVCESPDDDTPRLVFADWLDEHGEPERAEFIRVQIELARGPVGTRESALKTREQELLTARGDAWLEPFREYTSPTWRHGEWWEFRRGFVEGLAVDEDQEEDFYAASASHFAQTPLRALWLTNQQDFEPVAKWKGLASLSELVLEGSVLAADTGIGRLFRSSRVSNLRTLCLAGFDDNGHLDLPAVEELAGRTALRNVKHLDLSSNWASWQFGEQEWVRVLSGAPLLSRLDRLDLSGTWIRAEGVDYLAGTKRLATLKHLDLSGNEIGERGVRSLIESPYLGALQVLDLTECFGEHQEPISPATRAALIARFGDRVRL